MQQRKDLIPRNGKRIERTITTGLDMSIVADVVTLIEPTKGASHLPDGSVGVSFRGGMHTGKRLETTDDAVLAMILAAHAKAQADPTVRESLRREAMAVWGPRPRQLDEAPSLDYLAAARQRAGI